MAKLKVKSLDYPELELIMCEICWNDAVSLQYDEDITTVFTIGECDICAGNTSPEVAN